MHHEKLDRRLKEKYPDYEARMYTDGVMRYIIDGHQVSYADAVALVNDETTLDEIKNRKAST